LWCWCCFLLLPLQSYFVAVNTANRSKELACNFHVLLVCIDFLVSLSVFYSPSKEGSFLFMIVVVQVSLGTFLLRYLLGLLHLILTGISEDMHYPVCKL